MDKRLEFIKTFLKINLGILIAASGLYFFLIPSSLAVGGVTGFAVVVNQVVPSLSIGLIMLLTNAVLITLAFFTLGKRFGGYTIYNSLALSGLISLFEVIFPLEGPIVEDLFLMLIYGITIQAVGLAIVFNQDASTGGTDIIAAIINKYFHIDIGKALFLADFLVAASATYVLGIRLGLYAFLGSILNSTIIDKVISGFNTRIKMVVISKEHEKIKDYITRDIKRGVTVLYGEGGYSKESRRVINTILSRREYVHVKNKIKEIDQNAFIWTSVVSEVFGEGFKLEVK